MKRLFSKLVLFFVLLAACVVPVSADGYTVFVDEGLYGSVTKVGDPPKGAKLGFASVAGTTDYVVYDADAGLGKVYYRISSTNDKYYVKGVHISGHYLDAEEILKNADDVVVDEDLYLVSSFGVKGDQYSYKVYYYTEDGQNLMTLSGLSEECDTFHAYKDEKVIIGARTFDGYENYIVVRGHWKDSGVDRTVATRGFTGTISEDGTVIEYYYSVNTGEEEIITDEETVYIEGGGGGGTGGGAGGGGAAPVTPSEPTTPDIIDIDEPDVPQTEPEPSNNEPGNNEPEPIEPEPVPTSFWETLFSNPWLVGGIGAALAMLLFFLGFLFKRRKNNE